MFIAVVDLWDRDTAVSSGSSQRGFSDKGPLGVVDPLEREHDTILAQELLERRYGPLTVGNFRKHGAAD